MASLEMEERRITGGTHEATVEQIVGHSHLSESVPAFLLTSANIVAQPAASTATRTVELNRWQLRLRSPGIKISVPLLKQTSNVLKIVAQSKRDSRGTTCSKDGHEMVMQLVGGFG